jgi:serine protease inhibitor
MGMRQVDYIHDAEAARQAINTWTSDQTHAKIPKLFPMMQSDSDAQLAYARGPGWQVVDLPYDDGGLAMAVVVPDAGCQRG